MKRLPVILLALLLLAGCSDSQTSSQYVGDTSDGDNKVESTQNVSDEYIKYDILSYEKLENGKWKITNNWDDTIVDCSITIGYYDDENTLIDTIVCGPQSSLLPGQSGLADPLTPEDEYYSEQVVEYYYEPPSSRTDMGSQIYVNVIAKEVEIY